MFLVFCLTHLECSEGPPAAFVNVTEADICPVVSSMENPSDCLPKQPTWDTAQASTGALEMHKHAVNIEHSADSVQPPSWTLKLGAVGTNLGLKVVRRVMCMLQIVPFSEVVNTHHLTCIPTDFIRQCLI